MRRNRRTSPSTAATSAKANFSKTAPSALPRRKLPPKKDYVDSKFTKKDDVRLRSMFKELTDMVSHYRAEAERYKQALEAEQHKTSSTAANTTSSQQIELLRLRYTLAKNDADRLGRRCRLLEKQIKSTEDAFELELFQLHERKAQLEVDTEHLTKSLQSAHASLRHMLAQFNEADVAHRVSTDLLAGSLEKLRTENQALSLANKQLKRDNAALKARTTTLEAEVDSLHQAVAPCERETVPDDFGHAAAIAAMATTTKATRRRQPNCIQRFFQLFCCYRPRHSRVVVSNDSLYEPLAPTPSR